MTTKKIGIIGLGAVGTALRHVLVYFLKNVEGYDTKGDYDWRRILDCDVVFVCVSTPEGDNGRLDCSQVDSTLERLSRDGFKEVIAIKSTVGIGFMEQATRKYPQLRLVYCPEFLRERSRLQWTVCPDRIVLAGSKTDVQEVKDVLEWVEDAKVIVTDYRSAELGKLAHNAYIATKVSFTNEIERICNELGANSTDVMDVVTADRRIVSKEHLKPHLGPYGGKCVPKDTRELINAANSATLLKAVEEVNRKAHEEYEASQITGDTTQKSHIVATLHGEEKQ